MLTVATDKFTQHAIKFNREGRTVDYHTIYGALVTLNGPKVKINKQHIWPVETWTWYPELLKHARHPAGSECKENFEFNFLNDAVYHVQLELDSLWLAVTGSACDYVNHLFTTVKHLDANCDDLDTGLTSATSNHAFLQLRFRPADLRSEYRGKYSNQLEFNKMLSMLTEEVVNAWQITDVPCEYYLGQTKDILKLSVIYQSSKTTSLEICDEVIGMFQLTNDIVSCVAVSAHVGMVHAEVDFKVSFLFSDKSPSWNTPMLLKAKLVSSARNKMFLIRLPMKDKYEMRNCYI